MLSLLVEEDFALHVAVENGVVVFDDVGVIALAAFHIVVAFAAVEGVNIATAEQIILQITTFEFVNRIRTETNIMVA